MIDTNIPNTEKRRLIDDNERTVLRRRRSVWPRVIALLVLLALAWYIISKVRANKAAQDEQNQNVEAVTGNKSIMTDFNAVFMTENIQDLQDRPIEINSLLIRKVVIPDKVYLVSNTTANPTQLYVVIGDQLEEGSKTSLKQGQPINLKGTLHTVPSSVEEVIQKFISDKNQAQDFENHLIYAEATSIK
jgi:hypothetical protein